MEKGGTEVGVNGSAHRFSHCSYVLVINQAAHCLQPVRPSHIAADNADVRLITDYDIWPLATDAIGEPQRLMSLWPHIYNSLEQCTNQRLHVYPSEVNWNVAG